MATSASAFVSMIESSTAAAMIYTKLVDLTKACAGHSLEAIEIFNASLTCMINQVITTCRDVTPSHEYILPSASYKCAIERTDDRMNKHFKPTPSSPTTFKRLREGGIESISKHYKPMAPLAPLAPMAPTATKRSLEGGFESICKHHKH